MTATHAHLAAPGHWIDGGFTEDVHARIEVVSPVTGSVVATVPSGTAADVDRAVAAARAALPGWAGTPTSTRAKTLARLAQELTARNEQIAQAITAEIGAPIGFARMAQAGLPAAVAAATAELEPSVEWAERAGDSLIVREPVGVVGAITPWNFPLQQTMTKIAPALLAGNTIVFKPAELAPLTAAILAGAIAAAGIPAGVFNVVYGSGAVVGEAIAAHPGIDMLSFTGSTAVGKRVSVLAAQNVKRVGLELGGKSANIILDGADLEHAVAETLVNSWSNSGQACGAWTRLLVPADRHDEIVTRLAEAAAAYTVGDPADESVRLGPLASQKQWERVNAYIEQGIAEGATLAYGGPGRIPGLESGAYIRPTIFANVAPDSTIAQEEIFGPVLSVIPYTTEDEAIEIANSTIYGLNAAVFGAPEDALRVAHRLQVGQVYLNGAGLNMLAPFGGYKQSGNGREFGRHGVEEFTEVKAIQLGETAPAAGQGPL
ncbi:aldehyde dehydrogenase family protein [Actinomadura craniellae]|uniref:Aldehyde dehydrogenase family protein n=1 Tax=Actinomadura craniellae TaxID=2231787 RepID=A0A365GWT2_9ACTN|nr:aldehyde dehydrogenase family protein [Actinomadura craniellae]RAY11287.1 aldehyde dehydrogenase family protein [Actinomadura craniellae]